MYYKISILLLLSRRNSTPNSWDLDIGRREVILCEYIGSGDHTETLSFLLIKPTQKTTLAIEMRYISHADTTYFEKFTHIVVTSSCIHFNSKMPYWIIYTHISCAFCLFTQKRLQTCCSPGWPTHGQNTSFSKYESTWHNFLCNTGELIFYRTNSFICITNYNHSTTFRPNFYNLFYLQSNIIVDIYYTMTAASFSHAPLAFLHLHLNPLPPPSHHSASNCSRPSTHQPCLAPDSVHSCFLALLPLLFICLCCLVWGVGTHTAGASSTTNNNQLILIQYNNR